MAKPNNANKLRNLDKLAKKFAEDQIARNPEITAEELAENFLSEKVVYAGERRTRSL